MAGTRKNGMKWDRGRRIGRKGERQRRTHASVRTHHSVNNARSESDSKGGGILRVLPSVKKRGLIGGRRRVSRLRFHFSNISTFLIIDGAFPPHSPRTLWSRVMITRVCYGIRNPQSLRLQRSNVRVNIFFTRSIGK